MGETSDGKNGNRNTKNGKNNSGAFSSLFQHPDLMYVKEIWWRALRNLGFITFE